MVPDCQMAARTVSRYSSRATHICGSSVCCEMKFRLAPGGRKWSCIKRFAWKFLSAAKRSESPSNLREHPPSLGLSEVKHPEVNTGLAGGFEVDPRGSHDQAMVDYTELGTLVGPTIL